MPRIVLFKTKNAVNGTDAYHEAFAQAGYDAQYIPVLQETFHVNDLIQLISNKDTVWGGIVITSKRGAEGWAQAAQNCGMVQISSDFSAIQLYTVGTTALDFLSDTNPSLPDRLKLDASGAIQAKSASALLPIILQAPQIKPRPLLFIRGDKSTNELQHGLEKAELSYIETTVYSTTCRPSLDTGVAALLAEIRGRKEAIWLAFFSPSSAEMVLERFPSAPDSLENIKLAAIGETTAQFLLERGLKVDAVAREPTAEGLHDAIATSEAGTKRHPAEA